MSIRILVGDCRDTLATLLEQSVQTCVTSPPYFGLRDYGTAKWDGGDPSCAHQVLDARTVSGGSGKQYTNTGSNRVYSGDCKCGARRVDGQIGLEPTPDAFVAQMVAVFRDVRRVLKDDGTLWLNLGDSYAANRGYQVPDSKHVDVGNSIGMKAASFGAKPKDLLGIPWRVAFALQADGWYLRSDIIWHKPNPMPESVTDRPTKSHEYVFLLSKSQHYYYDAAAVAEDAENWGTRDRSEMRGGTTDPLLKHHGLRGKGDEDNPTRNKRTVWTVPTSPFKGAHFATFPPALIEPCIKAGSKLGDTVLDPFGGAGTTGLVADRLGREAILCELNPAYAEIARKRIADDNPLFTEVA